MLGVHKTDDRGTTASAGIAGPPRTKPMLLANRPKSLDRMLASGRDLRKGVAAISRDLTASCTHRLVSMPNPRSVPTIPLVGGVPAATEAATADVLSIGVDDFVLTHVVGPISGPTQGLIRGPSGTSR